MFWPGMAGAAGASRWALLAVAVPSVLFIVKPVTTWLHVVGIALLAWAAISLAWTTVFYDGLAAVIELTIIAGSFLIGQGTAKLRPLFAGMGLGLWVSSLVVILQYAGFDPVVTQFAGSSPSGLFVNPNILAEIAAPVFVGLMLTGQRLIAVGVAPSLMLTECRSAVLALGAVALVWLWQRWRWQTVLFVPCMAVAVYVAAPGKWLGGTSFSERVAIWGDTVSGLTSAGHGIGSFYSAFPASASRIDIVHAQPSHAHNDFLELAFELGIVGVVLFGAFAAMVAARGDEVAKMVFLAIAVESMFGFPLHSPATAFLFGAVAGHASRSWRGLRLADVHRGLALYARRQSPGFHGA